MDDMDKLGSNSYPPLRMYEVCVLFLNDPLKHFQQGVSTLIIPYNRIMSPLHKVPNNKCQSRPLTQISGILENRYIVVQ